MLTKAALEQGVPILQVLREKAQDPQIPTRSSRALRQFLELLDKWHGLQDPLSIAQLLEKILQDTRYKEMFQKQEAAAEIENRLANIEELIRAAAESEERGEAISEFLDRASLASELDHLDPAARVALMTLHSAKGLEFDVVFLAGLEEGLFPHSQSMDSNADIEEERRLCYVGITRAKRKLFITWTPFRKSYGPDAGFPAKVSRFLSEIPRELVEGLDTEEPEYFDQRSKYKHRFHERQEEYGTVLKYREERSGARNEPLPQPKTIAELKAYIQQKEQSGTTDKENLKSGPLFKAGVRVRHEQFGDGIVLSRERAGNEIKLTVTFSRVGRKSLIERYAKLKAL
jgi:DNA helicase-2/ATP-dependent DNA helicase PcrA